MADNKHGKASKGGRNKRWSGTSHSETKYVSSGGPMRAARRAATNHGCNLPALHRRGARDQKHAHERKEG
jgi:hypothetical protein